MHFFTKFTTEIVKPNTQCFPFQQQTYFCSLCANTNIFLMQNKCMQYITWHNVLAWGFQKIKLYWLCRKAEHRVNLGGKIRKEVRRNNSKNEDDEFMFTKTPKGQCIKYYMFNDSIAMKHYISYGSLIIIEHFEERLEFILQYHRISEKCFYHA